jgi:HEAT repeat protein
MKLARSSWLALLLLASGCVAGSAQDASDARALVGQLGQFQAEIDGRIQGNTGKPTPVEQRREAIYVKLRGLDARAIPALRQGLTSPDVRVRRNVALYLSFEGGNYARHADVALDVTPFLPQLVAALRDENEWVSARSAQALAHAGAGAAVAVQDLVRLLEDDREGPRIGACIGLHGIGPAARDALPALRRALGDPSNDVRRFAQRAIETVESPKP